MTIRSREIALRCASSLPRTLLKKRWPDEKRDHIRTVLGLPKSHNKLTRALVDQLTHCQDESAQRLLLGTSK